jgi:ketosteroid isomerase-like protein
VVYDLVSRISLGSFPFSIGRAKADPVEDGAAVWAQWEQVYNLGVVDEIVALYTEDSRLFGSAAQLFAGTEGARTYFNKLPAGTR